MKRLKWLAELPKCLTNTEQEKVVLFVLIQLNLVWRNGKKIPEIGTARIIDTFKKAAAIAADHGERLAAEGEICWAGMHSWKDMLDLLEGVGMPETLGFQADLAHTYLYLMGYNAPDYALLKDGYAEEEFWPAYEQMTDKLRPWTIDFHVAQNDGQVTWCWFT